MTKPVFAAVAVAAFAALAGPAAADQLKPACMTIQSEYAHGARPQFLRVVKKDTDLAKTYRSTLNGLKKGRYPTRAEIDRAYRTVLGRCGQARDRAACRTVANQLVEAARDLYATNRRWVSAGCPGTLGE